MNYNPENLDNYLRNPSTVAEPGLVNSILGNHTVPIQNAISKRTGLSQGIVGKLLAILLPLVLGHLGTSMGQQKIGSGGLMGFLENQLGLAAQTTPESANLARELSGTSDGKGLLYGLGKILGM